MTGSPPRWRGRPARRRSVGGGAAAGASLPAAASAPRRRGRRGVDDPAAGQADDAVRPRRLGRVVGDVHDRGARPARAGRPAGRAPRPGPAASSIDVDSSEMSRAGRLAMAVAMASRCSWPPDSDSVLAAARPPRPTPASSASTSTGYPGGSPQRRSSATVLPITCVSARCPTIAVPPGSPSPTRPGRRTRPLVGSAPASSDDQGGLPGPVRADDRDELPRVDGQVDIRERVPPAARVAEPGPDELKRHRRDRLVQRGVGPRGVVERVGVREPLDPARDRGRRARW